MKTYKIHASYVTYVSAIIEAESEEEAFAIAQDMDGGDFEQDRDTGLGDWRIDDVVEIEE